MNARLLRPTSSFSPKSIPGLKVWISAADYSSLTFNGSAVSTANDLSGNGFHAEQTVANNQPTYNATRMNGRPAFDCDSTDSLVSSATIADYIATPTSNPTLTTFMVGQCLTNTPLGIGSDNQANGRMLLVFNYGFNANGLLFDVVNASGGRIGGTIPAQPTSPSVITAYRHGASMAVRRDGALLASKSNASGNYTTTTAKLQIAKWGEVSSNTSYISEVLVYAAALSATQIASVERWLGRRWGITVA